MARKVKSFADKMKKSGIEIYQKCDVCGQNLIPHKIILPEFSNEKKTYKLPVKKVLICNCNEKEYFSN